MIIAQEGGFWGGRRSGRWRAYHSEKSVQRGHPPEKTPGEKSSDWEPSTKASNEGIRWDIRDNRNGEVEGIANLNIGGKKTKSRGYQRRREIFKTLCSSRQGWFGEKEKGTRQGMWLIGVESKGNIQDGKGDHEVWRHPMSSDGLEVSGRGGGKSKIWTATASCENI